MSCDEFNFKVLNKCTQIDIGYDFESVFTYEDSNDLAINITGFDFNMIIKDSLGGATVLTLSIVGDNLTTGFYIPNPTLGIINMQITDVDTGLIAAGNYPYEMLSTDTDSKVKIFMQGILQFSERGF